MPVLHLTDIAVRALKPTDGYVSYWDDTTPGFGIRVGKRSKTWMVMRGRNRERISIGKYGDLSLSEARAEAKRLLSTAPEPKAVALTFAKARERFIEENYRDTKPRTKAEADRLLKKHFKGLDHRQLHSIDDADVKRELDKLSDTPSEQLHAFRTARCFFRWCVRPPRRYIKHSPMEGYEPPSRDKRGTRILSDDELKAVWKAAEKPPHAIIRLLILWGTRNTETIVTERKWASDAVLTIPEGERDERLADSRPSPNVPVQYGPAQGAAGFGRAPHQSRAARARRHLRPVRPYGGEARGPRQIRGFHPNSRCPG